MQIKKIQSIGSMKYVIVILLIMAPFVKAEVYITEVMYNPAGEDNNKEYIEITSEDPINLSEYALEDLESSDSLALLRQANTSYYLIVEEGFNISSIDANIYTTGATIGNNLNNEGDVIIIRKTKIADIVIYSSALGASNDGKALCRRDSLFRNDLYPCDPTPGYANPYINQTIPSNRTNSTVPQTEDFSAIKINEVLPDPIGPDDAPLPQGEWIELYNTGSSSVDIAGLKLKDKSDNTVTVTSANVLEDTQVGSHSYKVIYMNGNSIINNNGFEQVRLFYGSALIDEMSYTGSIRGKSWSKIDDVFKITNATPGEQNVFYEEEAQVSQKKEEPAKQKESFLKIADIIPINASFGDTLKVKLDVYRGDTKKTSLQLGIEGLNKPMAMNLYTKYTNYTFLIPIQIKDNCQNKYDPGNYTVTVKGFGLQDSDIISIGNQECSQLVYSAIKSSFNNSGDQESFINYHEASDSNRVVYAGKAVAIEKYATYLFWAAVLVSVLYVMLYGKKDKSKINH